MTNINGHLDDEKADCVPSDIYSMNPLIAGRSDYDDVASPGKRSNMVLDAVVGVGSKIIEESHCVG